jgi:hypothetical protein
MAHEYIIRNGLVIKREGNSDYVLLDIQGTSGQLFSVTDDLTGTLFAVSDISGIPIMSVDASGEVKLSDLLTSTSDSVVVETAGVLGKRSIQDIISGAGYWDRSGSYLFPATLEDYVGIGTTTPTHKLDVVGTGRFSGILTSTVAPGTAPLIIASPTLVSNLNADMVDGLHAHTGVNNEANKVVRTNGDGYLMTGWINTVSGGTTATINRVYASTDAYIRYYTLADFTSQVFTQIKTIDGSGSGLDADLLDGHHWSEVTSAISIPNYQVVFGAGTGITGDSNFIYKPVGGLQLYNLATISNNRLLLVNEYGASAPDIGAYFYEVAYDLYANMYMDSGKDQFVITTSNRNILLEPGRSVIIQNSEEASLILKDGNDIKSTFSRSTLIMSNSSGTDTIQLYPDSTSQFQNPLRVYNTFTATNVIVTTSAAAGRVAISNASGQLIWTDPSTVLSGYVPTSRTLTFGGTSPIICSLTGAQDLSTNRSWTFSHSTADGFLHVPATGTTNEGKFLRAGATAGSIAWTDVATVTINNNADNRIITGSATSGVLEADSSFTYDASSILATITNAGTTAPKLILDYINTSASIHPAIILRHSATSYGYLSRYDYIGGYEFWDSHGYTAGIRAQATEDHSTSGYGSKLEFLITLEGTTTPIHGAFLDDVGFYSTRGLAGNSSAGNHDSYIAGQTESVLFVDASEDSMGIRITTPASGLHINTNQSWRSSELISEALAADSSNTLGNQMIVYIDSGADYTRYYLPTIATDRVYIISVSSTRGVTLYPQGLGVTINGSATLTMAASSVYMLHAKSSSLWTAMQLK